ncbi:unnamed protein product [Prunus armeniaca]
MLKCEGLGGFRFSLATPESEVLQLRVMGKKMSQIARYCLLWAPFSALTVLFSGTHKFKLA